MKKFALIGALALALLVGAASFATAGNATTTGNVTVTAKVSPKLTLTIDTPTVDFGDQNPGAVVTKPVNVTVSSNKDFTIVTTFLAGGDEAKMGLTTKPLLGGTAGKDLPFFDTYKIDVPWTTTPDVPLTATVVYTVTQQ